MAPVAILDSNLGLFDESRAQQLVDALVQEDARFPEAARDDLFAWARAQGLM